MTQKEINSLRQQLVEKIMAEFNEAVLNDSLEELAEKYGLFIEQEDFVIVNPRSAKILVLGVLDTNKKDLEKVCKNLRMPFERVEFIDDYSKMTGISVESLRYSNTYSDILIGPCPHKMKDLGDSKSLLSKMKNNPNEYPRVITLCANGKLKITKSSFEKGLKQTRLYKIYIN